jgi:DNA-binding beta-propeller fold protein YncE
MKLPENLGVGVVSAVDVDRKDNVWVLHRPLDGVPAGKTAAPPVLQFDSTGKYLQGWGGPGQGYDWPGREHALYVDDKDNVWIAGTARPSGGRGTGKSDDYIQKFSMSGKLLMQIGKDGASGGAKDTKNTYGAADLFVYPKTNELIVADEGNLRVMVLDADTGAFKRMWAAFGKEPVDPSPAATAATDPAPAAGARGAPPKLETEGPGPDRFSNTHGARVANDGTMYVVDRGNRRIQVFTLDGKYITQLFINRAGPSPQSASGLEFSVDPEQRFMYVSDYGNHHVVVVERKTLQVLYQFGKEGTEPGNFRGPHYLSIDSKGNLYVGEVAPGNRLQKFLFKGLGAVPASQS